MEKMYLFSWEEVPGDDSGRLLEFLKQEFDISWIETAKIEKIDNDRNIRVTDEKNYLSLGLNNKKTKVKLKIDDGRSYEFIAKSENGKLNIYEKIDKFHVGIAAEAFASGVFALCGYDVSVQYGANQPGYDLIIAKGDKILKVSVKGSQDGTWGLAKGYLNKSEKKETKYQTAANKWFNDQDKKTIFCFIQFKDIDLEKLDKLPRVYLATSEEVRDRLKESRRGQGSSRLYENHTWKSGVGVGTTDKIPDDWEFSKRIDKLFEKA